MRSTMNPAMSVMILASAIALGACAEAPPPPPPPPPAMAAAAPTTPVAAPSAAQPEPAASSAPAPAPLPPIKFEQGIASETPSPMPAVAIKAPKSSELIPTDKSADYSIKLDVKDWPTEHGGRHVHLILDNGPYKPIYDTTAPVRMADLNNGAPLAEGEHLLVAFPSRPNHESVKPDKGKSPLAITSFFVGKKAKSTFNPKAPMLIYSRPKGAYNGPMHTERVLIDFYTHSVALGEGQASINVSLAGPDAEGLKGLVIKEWKPFLLENLRNGDYTITLELVDKAGQPIAGAWNKATRKISVNRDAADDAKAGAPAPLPMSVSK